MICHIDCSELSEAKTFHLRLARFLDFPKWYGCNLDALFDCMTELPSPTRLYLQSWDHGQPWSTGFEAVFSDAQETCPELTVIYE